MLEEYPALDKIPSGAIDVSWSNGEKNVIISNDLTFTPKALDLIGKNSSLSQSLAVIHAVQLAINSMRETEKIMEKRREEEKK